MTKIIIDRLETWNLGKASGYFEKAKDEIHILSGEDQEFRTLVHETTHADRQNKSTFRLASFFKTPVVYAVLLTLLVFWGFYGELINHNLYGFIAVGFVFSIGFFCEIYEEYKADQAMLKSCQEIRVNRGRI
jgi:hypothetical protein